MKRSLIPFIGMLACIGAFGAHDEPGIAGGRVPSVRAESAGGNVSLRPARNDDDKEKARAKVREHEAGTYLPEMLLARDSTLTRWRARSRPITVWVQSRPDLDDWSDGYVGAVSEAFMSWDSVEGLPIHFAMVRDSSEAEIHVTWIPRFNEQISGRTRWSRNENYWIVGGDITLAVHHQQGDRLDEPAMKAMALHEVGHLIGLDHTSNPGSIMAPRVRIRDLAEIDKATVRALYSLDACSLR